MQGFSFSIGQETSVAAELELLHILILLWVSRQASVSWLSYIPWVANMF